MRRTISVHYTRCVAVVAVVVLCDTGNTCNTCNTLYPYIVQIAYALFLLVLSYYPSHCEWSNWAAVVAHGTYIFRVHIVWLVVLCVS